MKRIKRAMFLALVRFDLFLFPPGGEPRRDPRATPWERFMERANDALWPDYDGEGTGGDGFWRAVMGGK